METREDWEWELEEVSGFEMEHAAGGGVRGGGALGRAETVAMDWVTKFTWQPILCALFLLSLFLRWIYKPKDFDSGIVCSTVDTDAALFSFAVRIL